MPLVDTLDEFLDTLLTLQCLAPRATASTRAVLFGNGGGTSVLGTDAFDRAGFSIAAFDSSGCPASERRVPRIVADERRSI